MKQKIAILLIISFIIAFIPQMNTKAESSKNSTVFIDVGASITTGTEYNNNFVSVTSADSGIATCQFDKTTGNLTLTAVKKGQTTVTLKLGTAANYKEYIYTVNAIDVFDSVSYSYDYNKVTVNYDSTKIPAGCTPVFSIDGKNWSESATIARNKNSDGTIYKAYKVNNIVTGSIKVLNFDTKRKTVTDSISKKVTMNIGDALCIKDDLKTTEDYSLYMINGRTAINFDENSLTITATEDGNTTLTVETGKKTDFTADGSYTVYSTSYDYKITVQKSDSSTGSNNGNSTDNNGNSNGSTNSSGSNTGSSSSNSSGSSSSAGGIKNTAGTWKKDGTGWWFEYTNGSYPVWDWVYTDNNWYFFDRSGYMCSSEYRFGCWLNADGSWNTAYSNGTWKSNATGWWYEDNGWYPVNQWLKIDGYWYYFKGDGYMACNEYIDGYWLGSDGAWR